MCYTICVWMYVCCTILIYDILRVCYMAMLKQTWSKLGYNDPSLNYSQL